ncbi:MAG: [protein-PII] uridylyltransferase [Planctomycetia bacterium]|nr:[protein-PII] uridylyltransferase [Planctomycetia bacterium]
MPDLAMTPSPGLRPLVVDSKRRLAEGRERIRQRHEKGSPGIQVCRAMTELYDSIVLELYRAALEDLGEAGPDGLEKLCCVVAHGGTGRQDLAPYSDVDLMLLHAEGADAQRRTARLAERMMRDVFDVGLQLGQSVRTIAQACNSARDDATICTSLIESRRLCGSPELFDSFKNRYKKATMRRADALLAIVEAARGEERNQYGETVYLLEPNLKRSRGGLRDIQFVRWVGFLKYGMAEPDGLRLQGDLSREDFDALQEAWEFLLQLRNDMHFHAGKSSDVLDKAEQMRLAAVRGFRGNAGQLPVEEFMQQYFRLTSRVSGIATRFIDRTRETPLWSKMMSPLVSHRFERDFVVGPQQIGLRRSAHAQLSTGLDEILRLCVLANLYDKPIDRDTIEAIREAVPKLPATPTPKTAEKFLVLLDHSARLPELLRMLHEVGALEKILPEFAHARCLLQFNEYHKYTVDEHTFRAVEYATALVGDTGVLGQAYEGLKRKRILHLALLLHDLGKGYAEDHSEVGLRIAAETVVRLGIEEADGEALKFLVHKHLVMSHLAFRRDTSDERVLLKFAVDVGSPEWLQMLFVLTCCDTAAVGPGTLNAWKTEVLADLYRRTRRKLTSDAADDDGTAALDERRGLVRSALAAVSKQASAQDTAWYEKRIAGLPPSYLRGVAPERIAEDLGKLRTLDRSQAIAQARYLPESNTTEYWIGTYEDIAPGVFHRLTGALAAQGLQILSAEINTLDEGLIVDRFWVQDPDYAAEPSSTRTDEVCRALVKSLDPRHNRRPVFRRVWGSAAVRNAALPALPTRVQTDNNTSDRYTVVDIFAADRRGLLYTITRTLFDMKLSVGVAKIGTYVDQVVDVFYVVDQKGKKIDSTAKLNELRTRLLVEIEAWERSDASKQ